MLQLTTTKEFSVESFYVPNKTNPRRKMNGMVWSRWSDTYIQTWWVRGKSASLSSTTHRLRVMIRSCTQYQPIHLQYVLQLTTTKGLSFASLFTLTTKQIGHVKKWNGVFTSMWHLHSDICEWNSWGIILFQFLLWRIRDLQWSTRTKQSKKLLNNMIKRE